MGDANRDRSVGFSDLVAIAQHYGTTPNTWATGDFNYDGKVDFADLVVVAQNYGTTLAAPAASSPVASETSLAPAHSVPQLTTTPSKAFIPGKRPAPTGKPPTLPFNIRKRIAPAIWK